MSRSSYKKSAMHSQLAAIKHRFDSYYNNKLTMRIHYKAGSYILTCGITHSVNIDEIDEFHSRMRVMGDALADAGINFRKLFSDTFIVGPSNEEFVKLASESAAKTAARSILSKIDSGWVNQHNLRMALDTPQLTEHLSEHIATIIKEMLK